MALRDSGHLLLKFGHLARSPSGSPAGHHLVTRCVCRYCRSGVADKWTAVFSGVTVPTVCECDSFRCAVWTTPPSVGPNGQFDLYRLNFHGWVSYENKTGGDFGVGHFLTGPSQGGLPTEGQIKEVDLANNRVRVHFAEGPWFNDDDTIIDATNQATATVDGDIEVHNRRGCRWELNQTDVTGQLKVYTKTGTPECQAEDLLYTWNVRSLHVWLDVDGTGLEAGIYYLADRPGKTDSKLLLAFEGSDYGNDCDQTTVSNRWTSLGVGGIAGFDRACYDGNATVTPESLSGS